MRAARLASARGALPRVRGLPRARHLSYESGSDRDERANNDHRAPSKPQGFGALSGIFPPSSSESSLPSLASLLGRPNLFEDGRESLHSTTGESYSFGSTLATNTAEQLGSSTPGSREFRSSSRLGRRKSKAATPPSKKSSKEVLQRTIKGLQIAASGARLPKLTYFSLYPKQVKRWLVFVKSRRGYYDLSGRWISIADLPSILEQRDPVKPTPIYAGYNSTAFGDELLTQDLESYTDLTTNPASIEEDDTLQDSLFVDTEDIQEEKLLDDEESPLDEAEEDIEATEDLSLEENPELDPQSYSEFGIRPPKQSKPEPPPVPIPNLLTELEPQSVDDSAFLASRGFQVPMDKPKEIESTTVTLDAGLTALDRLLARHQRAQQLARQTTLRTSADSKAKLILEQWEELLSQEQNRLDPDLRGKYRFGIQANEIQNLHPKIRRLFSYTFATDREKLQARKKESINQWRAHRFDTGSAPVQINMITHKIKSLQAHLKEQPRDHANRRVLSRLMKRRRGLMLHLKRSDAATYYHLLAALNLKDLYELYPIQVLNRLRTAGSKR